MTSILRYIAVAWDARSTEDVATAKRILANALKNGRDWNAIQESDGFALISHRTTKISTDVKYLAKNAGVVLGTLFESGVGNDGVARQSEAIGPELTERLMATMGRSIIEDYWGSYILFLHHKDRKTTSVVNGPLSRLPCFYASIGCVRLFFSLPDDWHSLGVSLPSVNWNSIRAQATGGDYLTRETAINEVTSVISGECIEVADRVIRTRVYWNPSNLLRPPPITDSREAALAIKENTQLCVASWASLHSNILLSLSGGLDSSIVLSCLHKMQNAPRLTCVTFYSHGASDEREFARSMTDLVGEKLIEREFSQDIDLRVFMRCARTARPVLSFSAFDTEPVMLRIARERGATAIFNGEVGDDVFGRALGPEVLLEVARTSGYRTNFFQTAFNQALIKRISVWRALAQALRFSKFQNVAPYWSLHRYRQFSAAMTDRTLLSDETLDTYEKHLSTHIHPWFVDIDNTPPGRFQLVLSLMMATSTWSQSAFSGADDATFTMPLASQPLVQVSAAIHSQLHVANGLSGSVVRHAFSNDLSDLVVSRGSGKGSPLPWIRDAVNRNRPFLREILLDGLLVRERILDRKKIEKALSENVTNSKVPIVDIIIQLYIEAWLRLWTDPSIRAAT